MSKPRTWMLYGAAGHTGSVIAQHAQERGHRPLLAGRNASAIAAESEKLKLECRVVGLDDPAALVAALSNVDLGAECRRPVPPHGWSAR